MRWLVTGGLGFIGQHLVRALLDRDLGDVLVLDNLRRPSSLSPSTYTQALPYEVIVGDIRDPATVLDACRGVDVVVHLAAHSNVMGSEAEVQGTNDSNVGGTLNVLAAASALGVQRVVFSSSREVYGDPESLPVREDAPLAPKNLYGATKAAAEMYCGVFRQRGLDVRILRLSNVYGPGDSDRVIPIWLERAQTGQPLEVYGGRQVLDLIWVDTVVDSMIAAGTAPSFPSTVNIGSGHGVPIVELAARVIDATRSSSEVRFLPSRSQEVIGFTADVGAMQRLGIDPPGDPLMYLPLMAAVPATAGV